MQRIPTHVGVIANRESGKFFTRRAVFWELRSAVLPI
jgi:hypothetical protein